ncbi:MAG: discoidin domain-containing protein, partial [Planctomycetes bacterium]|nr:discoidin domain-containing protein [Planctomycetota bacterium]
GWTPGEFANTHNVYLGVTFDDVNNATVTDPGGVLAGQGLADATLDPGRLEFDQTYYWRVDEVNAAPDSTVFKGGVWSFTIEPFSIPVPDITATASSSFGASGPEKTVDGSGMTDDLHGTSAADMWISGGIPATIEYAFDRAYKLHELWIWNSNQLIEAFVGFGAKDVVIEYSLDGENWTVLEGVGPLARGAGTEGYAQNNTIDFGGAMAQRVRLTINSVQGIAPQASLSEIRFYFIPVNAREPQPADGGSAEAVNTTLRWRAGREAAEHEVVLSQDQAAVADGSAGAVVLQESHYTPDPLLYSETYYWQVIETNAVSTPSRYEGPIWSFMAPEYLTIDDFETYADEPFLEIWDTWKDGFEDPGNGAIVGNGNEPERSIVAQGGKSMPIRYDNRTAPISAATRTFDPALDWTVGAPTSLSLHIRGDAANDGQPMYVTVMDRSGRSATVFYKDGDPAATLSDVFEPWIIPLADLAPVSLSSVASVSVGVGTPGGAPSGAQGTAYVDLLRVGTPLP